MTTQIGPWQVFYSAVHCQVHTAQSSGPDERTSAKNAISVRFSRDGDEHAKAKLIAAAPELFEALQRTLSWLTSYQGHGAMGPKGPYEQARAALDKAEGRVS